jgi:carboxyl-terminal processing protease
MAVLVNGNTASAGELFAACLKDYEKAVLVGETTFGKGSMQTTMSFSDGTAFKYTFRYYCPPFSDNYDGVGIKPDVKAELSKEALSHFYTLTDAEDTQLQAAVEELNK